MKIRMECPTCGQTLRVDERSVGRKGKCPKCLQAFLISRDEPNNQQPVAMPPIIQSDVDTVRVEERISIAEDSHASRAHGYLKIAAILGIACCFGLVFIAKNHLFSFGPSQSGLKIKEVNQVVDAVPTNDSEPQHDLSSSPTTEPAVETELQKKWESVEQTANERANVQESIAKSQQTLDTLRKNARKSREKYEEDERIVREANEFIGGLSVPDQLTLQRLEAMRKQGEKFDQWEIEKGLQLAPRGTTLFDALNEMVAEAIQQMIVEHERAVANAEKELHAKLGALVKRIAESKSKLKRAKIADDSNTVEKITQTIRQNQVQLRNLVEMRFEPLDERTLATKQIGTLPPQMFHGIHAVNRQGGKASGYVAEIPHEHLKGFTVTICGLLPEHFAQENLVRLKEGDTFFVANGSDGDKCEIHRCEFASPFTADELELASSAANADFKLNYTEEEEALMKATVERNQSALKSRRSNSFLESGRILLKKGNQSAARKQFEKAIAEDPDSETGKEAAKLLKSLP